MPQGGFGPRLRRHRLDGLGALGTTFTRLGFTAPLKPAMITGQDTIEAEADTSYRYVLQPVRLAG